jgi:hypothetical protein
MKIDTFLIASFVSLAFYLTANFCEKKTDGFSMALIHSDLTYDPKWEISALSRETDLELERIFSQKFHYLGCGGQSFAFVSEDNEYVIKFFKQKNFRKPYSYLLTLPLPSILELSRLRKLDKALFKMNRDFSSYKLAYEELREESGLIYIHLNKGTQLNSSLKVIDKIGIEHEIDLDQIEFVVQRRAEHLYPYINALMANGDLTGAKQSLHAVLEIIVSRCKKGIFDEDPRIHNNLGLIGSKAIFIDIGRFVRDPQRVLPSVYLNDLNLIIAKRFYSWLEDNHPILLPILLEDLKTFDDQENSDLFF